MARQLMAIGRTVWGAKVPTLKGTKVSLFYEQWSLYLVSSPINILIFHITWLDTFWTDLVCHIFFIHSSVKGHSICFHILATVKSAKMNTEVVISLWDPGNLLTLNAWKSYSFSVSLLPSSFFDLSQVSWIRWHFWHTRNLFPQCVKHNTLLYIRWQPLTKSTPVLQEFCLYWTFNAAPGVGPVGANHEQSLQYHLVEGGTGLSGQNPVQLDPEDEAPGWDGKTTVDHNDDVYIQEVPKLKMCALCVSSCA